MTGFSVLVSTAVFGFSLFEIRVSVFMNQKSGYSVSFIRLSSSWASSFHLGHSVLGRSG